MSSLAQIYRFLGQAIRYPQADWFTNDFFNDYHGLLASLNWPMPTPLPSQVSKQFMEDVQVEYTRLSINAIPQVIAPPYGSAFMDGSLNGPWADKTRDYYQKFGFSLTTKDFPDHLVTQLDFIALREEEEEGGSEDFLKKIFRPWFTLFHNKVMENSTEIYLTTTIKLIDFFTREEREEEESDHH